jgi:hypothetical protein
MQSSSLNIFSLKSILLLSSLLHPDLHVAPSDFQAKIFYEFILIVVMIIMLKVIINLVMIITPYTAWVTGILYPRGAVFLSSLPYPYRF